MGSGLSILLSIWDYPDGIKFVQECYRVLKFGGKLRVSTPDLRFLIELYNENETELQKEYIAYIVDNFISYTEDPIDTFVINNFFKDTDPRGFGHKFIYDYKLLEQLLFSCKFVDVKRFMVGESDDSNLRGIELHGHVFKEREDFNRLESMVVEARK